MNSDILFRVAIAMIAGWFIGFMMSRSILKEKYRNNDLKPQGLLKIVYNVDDPSYPAMGLEIESLGYLLNHKTVLLSIYKEGFPSNDMKVTMRSSKDESA